jgi:hypothetical protein
MTIAKVGVPFLVVLEEYESMSQRDDHILAGGTDPSRRLDHFASIVDFLSYWVSSAQSSSIDGGQPNSVRQELSRSIASGRLMPKIDNWKSKLEAMPGASDILDRLRAIEEATNYIV